MAKKMKDFRNKSDKAPYKDRDKMESKSKKLSVFRKNFDMSKEMKEKDVC